MGLRNHAAFPRLCYSQIRAADPYFNQRGLTTARAVRDHVASLLSDLDKELSTLPPGIHTVLSSSEVFYFRLNRARAVANLRTIARSRFNDIRIAVYLREQSDLIESLYTTHLLLTTSSQSLWSFARRLCAPRNRFLDYGHRLKLWADTFGTGNMTVRLFDRREMEKGNVVEDFAKQHLAGVGHQLPDTNLRVNRSVSRSGQRMLRLINHHVATRHRLGPGAHYFREAKTIIARLCRGRGERLSPSRKKSVHLRFAAGNEVFRTMFFPERKTAFAPHSEPES